MKSSMESYSTSKSISRDQGRCSDSSNSDYHKNISNKKRKHRQRRTESYDDDDSSDYDRHRKKKKKKEKRKTGHGSREKKSRGSSIGKTMHKRRRSHSEEQSESTCSESSYSYDRKKRNRHEKSLPKTYAIEKKHGEKDRKKQQQPKDKLPPTNSAIEFASALHALLAQFQDMGEQLITMLYRMSSGTSFDLDHVNPTQLRTLLTRLFETLRRYGIEQSMEGSWHWLPANKQVILAPAERKRREVALIHLVRQLLNDAGLTMDAINAYEMKEAEDLQKQKLQSQESKFKNASLGSHKLMQALNNILTTYGSGKSTKEDNIPLEIEIIELFESILQGEAVGLDGIPNERLRCDLEKLFQLVGLEKVIEEEDDTASTERHEIVYALPEDSEDGDGCSSKAWNHAMAVQNECRDRAARKPFGNVPALPQRGVIGPAVPTSFSDGVSSFPSNLKNHGIVLPGSDKDEDSTDDEGPAPASSEKCKRRFLIQKRRITKEEAKQLVRSNRQSGAIDAVGKAIDPPNSREEWMLIPGKHTFLEGVLKKGPAVNRQFKNEKTLGRSTQRESTYTDPSVRQEMEQLMELNQQRILECGMPSLMQLHQEKIARSTQKSDGKKQIWTWSRQDDLDNGRRIDKSALHSMLGSAEENLKTKFAGSFTGRFT